MSKQEMVSRLMKEHPDVFFSRVYAEKAYDAVIKTLASALVEREHLTLPKIGKLDIVVRKPRYGTDPRTQERILIPEHRAIAFTTSVAMKTLLNE